jgi:hypothetical protein
VRTEDVGSWTGGTPSLREAQLVQSLRLEPLLAASAGILIGRLRQGRRTVVVLADPDLIENHGLERGDNARIAVELIESLRAGGDGEVVFDEFIHGFTAHPFHMLGILFQFPFALVTVQLGLAVGLLVWAAMARFGTPAAAPPAMEAGKRSLVETGARLLDQGGRMALLAERYGEALVRDTGRRMHAPRGLAVPALLAWLAQTGKTARLPVLTGDGSAPAALRRAQEICRWRKEVLGGSRQDP